jgi:aspartyl-tRNA synthetase
MKPNKILGRIFKRNNNFYFVHDTKTITIKPCSGNKINNGDLVSIKLKKLKHGNSISQSEICVVKKIPINIKTSPEIPDSIPLNKRLENRIINLRNEHQHTIFLVRDRLMRALADAFRARNYLSVNLPTLVGPSVSGRVQTFKTKLADKDIVLTMTKSVHLRYLTCADFNKVYDMSPVFVSGYHTTSDHLSEYYVLDWANTDSMNFKTNLKYINTILKDSIKNLSKDISIKETNIKLNFVEILNNIQKSKIITYKELLNSYLKTKNYDVGVKEQFHLPDRVIDFAYSIYGNCFWITEFPEKFKQFYCDTKKDKDNNIIVIAAELWLNKKKIVAISYSGSDHKKTIDRIKLLGLNGQHFRVYLEAIQMGSPETYLGSIYIERLLMTILDIKNMKEVVMFPRSPKGTPIDP